MYRRAKSGEEWPWNAAGMTMLADLKRVRGPFPSRASSLLAGIGANETWSIVFRERDTLADTFGRPCFRFACRHLGGIAADVSFQPVRERERQREGGNGKVSR